MRQLTAMHGAIEKQRRQKTRDLIQAFHAQEPQALFDSLAEKGETDHASAWAAAAAAMGQHDKAEMILLRAKVDRDLKGKQDGE